jgi:endonuclease-3
MDRETACDIYRALIGTYPEAVRGNRYRNTPFQALITTILSAQTTDRSVDMVRGLLFSRFPDPVSLARALLRDVEEIIRPTGFYHIKARRIIDASGFLVREYSGRVPDKMEDLLRIPGVGRKTANIVLYHVFGKNEGIAVDTHVLRLAGRIGFSGRKTPEEVEADLMQLFPGPAWGDLTDLLIAHGRSVCTARKPKCPECGIREGCRYYRDVFLAEGASYPSPEQVHSKIDAGR